MKEILEEKIRKIINAPGSLTRWVAGILTASFLLTGVAYHAGKRAGTKEANSNGKSEIGIVSDNTVDIKYKIKYGDTLSYISMLFDVSIENIMNANDLTNSNIYAGNELIIPDVDSETANKYYEGIGIIGTEEDNIDIQYMVAEDDTLEGIATKFNVAVEDIVDANDNIKNKNIIYRGDILIIPNVSKQLLDIINYSNINGDTPIITEEDNIQQGYQDKKLPEGYIRGIDISSLNGEVDWDIIEEYYENDIISYVIFRMAENYDPDTQSRKFTLDEQFERNLAECNKRGIPYGVYIFSRGSNEKEINTETSSIINYINNNLNQNKIVNGEELDLTFSPSLPIYMDCFEEDAASQYSIYANGNYDYCAELIKLWCNTIEDAGYFPGVYCSGNFYNKMGIDRLCEYSLWVAHYGNVALVGDVGEMTLNGKVTFGSVIQNQQVTERGTMEGMDCNFDVNVTDADLLRIVENFYLNRRNENTNILRLIRNR